MTRYLYGGTTGDWTADVAGRVDPSTPLVVATAPNTAAVISDITTGPLGSVTAGVVTSDGEGAFSFYGPDGHTSDLWARAQAGGTWRRIGGPAASAAVQAAADAGTVLTPAAGDATYEPLGAIADEQQRADAAYVQISEPPLNVTRYQAAGDGADLTTALPVAIAAATGRGEVYIPPGVWDVNPMTISQSRTTLLGAHSGSFNAGATARASVLKLKPGANASMFTLADTALNFILRDLALDGNKANQTALSHGIYLPTPATGQDSMPLIEDCYLHDFRDNAVEAEQGRRGGKVVRGYIWGCRNGVVLRGSDWGVYDCVIGTMTEDGVQVREWTAKIAGCDIFTCRSGINTFAGLARLTTITGNMIDRHQQSGIYLGGEAATVTGNVFHSNSQAAAGSYHHVQVAENANVVIGNTFGADAPGTAPKPAYDIFIAAGKTAVVAGNTRRVGSSASGHLSGTSLLVGAPLGALPAAATDPATTQALVNDIRAKLIAAGLYS